MRKRGSMYIQVKVIQMCLMMTILPFFYCYINLDSRKIWVFIRNMTFLCSQVITKKSQFQLQKQFSTDFLLPTDDDDLSKFLQTENLSQCVKKRKKSHIVYTYFSLNMWTYCLKAPTNLNYDNKCVFYVAQCAKDIIKNSLPLKTKKNLL